MKNKLNKIIEDIVAEFDKNLICPECHVYHLSHGMGIENIRSFLRTAVAKVLGKELQMKSDGNQQNEDLISLIENWRINHEGQRFGQWLCNLTQGDQDPELFYLEDQELIKLIENENKELISGT